MISRELKKVVSRLAEETTEYMEVLNNNTIEIENMIIEYSRVNKLYTINIVDDMDIIESYKATTAAETVEIIESY